jgi:hypothetical protein
MGTKIYGYHRVEGNVTMTDNATVSDGGGWIQSSGGGIAASDGIVWTQDLVWGAIRVPTGWVAADVAYLASETRGGTYTLVYIAAGTLARSVVGSTTVPIWIAIPDEVFRCGPFWKIQSTNTASTATVSQTGGPLTLSFYLGS